MKRGSGIVAAWMCAFSGFELIGSVGVASAQVTLLGPNTRANGVSADGSVVTGETTSGATKAFAWTAAGGRVDFGAEPGMPLESLGLAVSGNGSTVVGASLSGAFRWRGPGTFELIGQLPEPVGHVGATGVSGDGSVIVGWGLDDGAGIQRSFYWTQSAGMQQIPGVQGRALGVSRNTGVVVGTAGIGNTRGFTWSPSGGTRVLQAPAGATTPETTAAAINFDGTIVVGTSSAGPTVWRNEVGAPMPEVPGFGFFPQCLNDDASVVAGWGYNSQAISYAMIWTRERRTELFGTYLVSQGISFPNGFFFSQITGVSADGRTFVGYGGIVGQSTQGFMVTVPSPSSVALSGIALAVVAHRRRRVFGAR